MRNNRETHAPCVYTTLLLIKYTYNIMEKYSFRSAMIMRSADDDFGKRAALPIDPTLSALKFSLSTLIKLYFFLV